MRKQMEALIQEMLDGRILLTEAVGEFEKIYIQKALELNGDHLMKTAESLGIHRNTLSSRLATYNGSTSSKVLVSKTRKRSLANIKKKPSIKTAKAKAAGGSK